MKLLFFSPVVIFFLVFGILVVGFLFLVAKIIVKTRASSWEGKIIDKLYHERTEEEDGRDTTSRYYTLVVKTNENLTRKVAVTRELYDSCAIGDTLVKPQGALNPVKKS